MKKILLIDLDGVLNEYRGNFKNNYIEPPRQNTKEFLEKLSQKYEIKIFTTRNKFLTTKWLIKNELDKYISDVTNIKEPATYIIVDDRCICFDGNYNNLSKAINTYKPYWSDL